MESESNDLPWVIYSGEGCSWCVRAKAALDRLSEAYEERDVSNPEFLDDLKRLGLRTIPQIFYSGEYIGGHDRLVEFIKGLPNES